jgi:hypothetical protein
MGPIEILWATIAIMFVVVAMVRGYDKELGATTIMLVGLLLLSLLTDLLHLDELLRALLTESAFDGAGQQTSANLVVLLTYQGIFVLVTMAGYAGRVLTWEGVPIRGVAKTGFNLLVGAVNGWLVAGTLWYYLHLYNYPVPESIFRPPLSSLAQELVKYLPPEVLSFTSLIIILVILLLVRVRR